MAVHDQIIIQKSEYRRANCAELSETLLTKMQLTGNNFLNIISVFRDEPYSVRSGNIV